MVRKLTSRLTRITLLALAAACILLVAAINGANALIVRAQIDESLSLLMTSSGQLYTSVQEGSGAGTRHQLLHNSPEPLRRYSRVEEQRAGRVF